MICGCVVGVFEFELAFRLFILSSYPGIFLTVFLCAEYAPRSLLSSTFSIINIFFCDESDSSWNLEN